MPLMQQLVQQAANGQGNGHALCITARAEHGVHSVDLAHALLGVVMDGTKQVRCGDVALQLAAGQMLAVRAGARLDAVNRPDVASGRYCTLGIPLCEEVLAAARLLRGDAVLQAHGTAVAAFGPDIFAHHLYTWAQALLQNRYAAARTALVALVIAIGEQGMDSLLYAPPPTLAAQIRAAARQQPARAWQSRDFEALLGLSGATLRRRLAAEGTSLRLVLQDARLACALDLLYTTHLPLKTLAAKVGYRSAESFAKAFELRYGLAPADIGNSPD